MSTQKLPTFRAKTNEPIGVELFFALPDFQDYEKSYLEADSAVGTTIYANGLNFAANDYIILGQIGYEKTEICKVLTVSATQITLASTSIYPHVRGDSIRFIPYNQIIVETSPDDITYTPATAIPIDINAKETYLQRASDTSSYSYKFRFFNSTTTKYSAYSDIITGLGYGDNSVFSVKKRALNALGEKYDNLLTNEFLNEALREARRNVDQDPRILRWSFRSIFNHPLYSIIPGTFKVALPLDLRDRFTNKNILGVRVGKQSYVVEYQDNMRFRQNYYNKPHTTIAAPVVFGATSVTLAKSGDFQESGAIDIAGSAVNVQKTIINYTANNEVTNVISGVTGVPAAGYAVGTDVWQNTTFGVPRAYTVENGYMLFDLPFDNQSDGEGVYIDYYTSLVEINNDAQTFDEPFYDMYVSYLKYMIKYKKSNGKLDRDTDSDYKDWTEGITRLISQELMGQNIRFIPTVSNRLSGIR
jgi:hypothetical protein